MRRNIRSWIKENPVLVLWGIALVSISCDLLCVAPLNPELLRHLDVLSNHIHGVFDQAWTVFLFGWFLLDSARVKSFVFNRSKGFYLAMGALFCVFAVEGLRNFHQHPQQVDGNTAVNAFFAAALLACGLTRHGDADWVEPEELHPAPESPMFQSGIF